MLYQTSITILYYGITSDYIILYYIILYYTILYYTITSVIQNYVIQIRELGSSLKSESNGLPRYSREVGKGGEKCRDGQIHMI